MKPPETSRQTSDAQPRSLHEVLEELGPPKPFQQHVWVRPDVGTVEIALEGVSCYHEWIKGEGAYISVWRAMDDNRVVGATLPLRNWRGSMPVDVSSSNAALCDPAHGSAGNPKTP